MTETIIEESASQETEIAVEIETEIKKIIELPPIPEDAQPLHKVSAELDAKINNVNIPYNYLPSYQSKPRLT